METAPIRSFILSTLVLCSVLLGQEGGLFSGKLLWTDDWKKDPIYKAFFKSYEEDYWISSSFLSNSDGTYSEKYLSDTNLSTAWVEGKSGYGNGEQFLFGVARTTGISHWPNIKKILIATGYQKSEALFKENGRPKNFLVTIYPSIFFGVMPLTPENTWQLRLYVPGPLFEKEYSLADKMGFQEIAISLNQKMFVDYFKRHLELGGLRPGAVGLIVILTIKDVYPGTKYEDTCISEIKLETERVKGNILEER